MNTWTKRNQNVSAVQYNATSVFGSCSFHVSLLTMSHMAISIAKFIKKEKSTVAVLIYGKVLSQQICRGHKHF